ncbi:MAG: hypothetical protein LBB77_02720 [Treponema sp.]|nr:hypothetical protein [Treponema sp.]
MSRRTEGQAGLKCLDSLKHGSRPVAGNGVRLYPAIAALRELYTIKWDDGHSNRIDLLCLDRTTRELVIVENKISGRNKTVITQYAKYKAWAKHHLDELNEKYKDKNLKATENLKVVIITDTTDGSMEITCKDENIPLIYIDGGVIFEEIVSYNNY